MIQAVVHVTHIRSKIYVIMSIFQLRVWGYRSFEPLSVLHNNSKPRSTLELLQDEKNDT